MAKDSDQGHGQGDEHRLVGITINNDPYQIARGRRTVVEIKTLGHIPLADDLEQVVDGQLTLLADDGHVQIHGGEVFVSHIKSGGSSFAEPMLFPADQLAALKGVMGPIEYFEEGKRPYILLPDHALPPGTAPARCDLVLCPHERDGYASRLFFSERVTKSPSATSKDGLNWNGSARLLERNWFAYSWKVPGGPYPLLQLLALHLRALQ